MGPLIVIANLHSLGKTVFVLFKIWLIKDCIEGSNLNQGAQARPLTKDRLAIQTERN